MELRINRVRINRARPVLCILTRFLRHSILRNPSFETEDGFAFPEVDQRIPRTFVILILHVS